MVLLTIYRIFRESTPMSMSILKTIRRQLRPNVRDGVYILATILCDTLGRLASAPVTFRPLIDGRKCHSPTNGVSTPERAAVCDELGRAKSGSRPMDILSVGGSLWGFPQAF